MLASFRSHTDAGAMQCNCQADGNASAHVVLKKGALMQVVSLPPLPLVLVVFPDAVQIVGLQDLALALAAHPDQLGDAGLLQAFQKLVQSMVGHGDKQDGTHTWASGSGRA